MNAARFAAETATFGMAKLLEGASNDSTSIFGAPRSMQEQERLNNVTPLPCTPLVGSTRPGFRYWRGL